MMFYKIFLGFALCLSSQLVAMDVPRKKLVDFDESGETLYTHINALKPENYGPLKNLVIERIKLQNKYSFNSHGCKFRFMFGFTEQQISEMKKEMNEHVQEYRVKGIALAQLIDKDPEAKSEQELRAELSAEMNQVHWQLEFQNIMDSHDF